MKMSKKDYKVLMEGSGAISQYAYECEKCSHYVEEEEINEHGLCKDCWIEYVEKECGGEPLVDFENYTID